MFYKPYRRNPKDMRARNETYGCNRRRQQTEAFESGMESNTAARLEPDAAEKLNTAEARPLLGVTTPLFVSFST